MGLHSSHFPHARAFAGLLSSILFASVVPLFPADGALEPFPDGSVGHTTSFTAEDGTVMAAYLRTPKGDGPFPAVVLIHGGGNSVEGTFRLGRSEASPRADFLAQGWAVYSIDFRPKSSFQPIEWDDACRAVATLAAMPFIDAKRIAMMGGSHGGYNTARVAARCDLRCAIACAPAAIDLDEVARAKAAGFKLSPQLERVLAGPPAGNAPGAFDEVGRVRCPLLLISGKNDASSPPSVMEAYAVKLRAAGKEVELYLPENGPHGFYFGRPRIPETDEAARRAVAFIAKHFGVEVKPGATAGPPQPAPAAPEPAAKTAPDGRAAQLFRRLDANRDGKIAGDEAASEPGKRFVRMFDQNGDGIVTLAEIGGGSSASSSRQPDAAGARSAVTGAETQRGSGALTELKSFHSAALKGEVSYTLYLPPSYEREARWRFPVVFWLHGGGGGPGDCWKFVEITDAAIKAGRCPEMIIVGVDGRSRGGAPVGSQYSDWKDGSLPMETALIQDLLPHIDATYRTWARREARALEGFSMGGHGALMLAFRHPELFGAATALGPALIMPGDGGNRVQEVYRNGAYKGDEAYWREHDPLTIAERNPERLRGNLFLRLITGEAEGNFTHRRTIELSAKLKSLGIEHEFIRPGETGHNCVKYYEAMPDAPGFYAKVFGKPAPKAELRPSPTGTGAAAAVRPADGASPQWVLPVVRAPRLQHRTFESAAAKATVSYFLYAPEQYDTETRRRFPVLYWLHGTGGGLAGVPKLAAHFDAAIRAGRTPPMLVVFPNGLATSMWCDSKDGSVPMEAMVVKELVPHIDATFRTIDSRAGRLIEGFSMGGYGAARLGFKHHDVFGAVSILAGGPLDLEFMGPRATARPEERERILQTVFGGDLEYFKAQSPWVLAEQNAAALRGRTRVRQAVGDRDSTLGLNRRFSEHLGNLEIPHALAVLPGVDHNPMALLNALGESNWTFYRAAFGAEAGVPASAQPKLSTATADPAPPQCYDLSKAFPGEIPQYRVSRTSRPVEPFEILDGLYYVGNSQVSAHLLKTGNGLVLIDSTMPHQVPWLLDSIRKLGFDPRDVKVVVGGHAHVDHIGGHWYLQHHFGAQTWLHEADASATETGRWEPGKRVVLDGTIATISVAFPPFQTDRRLRDGETIEWGGRRLTFHSAPGHTPGTLFIEFPLRDQSGQPVLAGLLGGMTPGRPEFAETLRRLKAVDVQVWLGAHPNQNNTFDKQRRLHSGKQTNPFIDPEGWKAFLSRLSARGGSRSPSAEPSSPPREGRSASGDGARRPP